MTILQAIVLGFAFCVLLFSQAIVSAIHRERNL
jgi:hypothetical protein